MSDPMPVEEIVSLKYRLLVCPHLKDYITDLKFYPSPLLELTRERNYQSMKFTDSNSYLLSSVKGGVILGSNLVSDDSHLDFFKFPRVGPRAEVCFQMHEVRAAIVVGGAPSPGTNAAIREIVMTLSKSYNSNSTVYGVVNGMAGLHSRPYVELSPSVVSSWHTLGGSELGVSDGPVNVKTALDALKAHGVNQLYVIGGEGTHKAAAKLWKEAKGQRLKMTVACIPKNVSNDFPVIDRSFGFDTAVQEAQAALESANVEASSGINGVGLVKLMGKRAGFLAMFAAVSSGIVDVCLIPDVPFELFGPSGVLVHIEKTVKAKGKCVVVIAEGCHLKTGEAHVDSKDCGRVLQALITDHFASIKTECNLKYIDPTFSIRSIKANTRDQEYCMKLGQNAVHGAMHGYTGFTVGPIGNRYVQIPIDFINSQKPRRVEKSDAQWIRLILSTGQPSFAPPLNSSSASILPPTVTPIIEPPHSKL